MTDTTTLILRDRNAIPEATMPQLLATYKALTGAAPKKFENISIARRRVEMAMMAAQDADAHLGVAKGANGEVKTVEELTVKAEEAGVEAPNMDPDKPVTFPEGSLAAKLQNVAGVQTPIVPRPRATAKPKTPREPGAPRAGALLFVKATGEGSSKVRTTSARGAVYAKLLEAKNEDGTFKPVAVKFLDDHFQSKQAGHLQKLIALGHAVAATADGTEVVAGPAPIVETPTETPTETPIEQPGELVVAQDLDGVEVILPPEDTIQPGDDEQPGVEEPVVPGSEA